jgi:hypothetical protein
MHRLLPAVLALALAACAADPAPSDPSALPIETTDETSLAQPASAPAEAPVVTVYKSPTCGCCVLWADHMEAEGFRVESRDVNNLAAVRDSLGVPSDLAACHTAVVDGYVVEGHVPAEHVRRLLDERPEAVGLSVPGMPLGSPGMEQGDLRQPYNVLLVGAAGEATVFAHVPGS